MTQIGSCFKLKGFTLG